MINFSIEPTAEIKLDTTTGCPALPPLITPQASYPNSEEPKQASMAPRKRKAAEATKETAAAAAPPSPRRTRRSTSSAPAAPPAQHQQRPSKKSKPFKGGEEKPEKPTKAKPEPVADVAVAVASKTIIVEACF
ncbi:hypothetical protein ACLOJK_030669 [Asimina triloba]